MKEPKLNLQPGEAGPWKEGCRYRRLKSAMLVVDGKVWSVLAVLGVTYSTIGSEPSAPSAMRCSDSCKTASACASGSSLVCSSGGLPSARLATLSASGTPPIDSLACAESPSSRMTNPFRAFYRSPPEPVKGASGPAWSGPLRFENSRPYYPASPGLRHELSSLHGSSDNTVARPRQQADRAALYQALGLSVRYRHFGSIEEVKLTSTLRSVDLERVGKIKPPETAG